MLWNAIGPSRPFFVDRSTLPGTTILTARIHLTGDPALVSRVRALEASIEEHMRIPGYAVNVEFVDRVGPAVTTIPIDPRAWTNSAAWNPFDDNTTVDIGDAYAFGHELMHTPFGLPDEYDLQHQFANPHMSSIARVGAFFHRLVQPELPRDHAKGIMDNHWNRPLVRQYQRILASLT